MTRSPEAVISQYAKVARPILIKSHGVKSCVESTRVTVECLRRFGVRAEVVPVSLRVKSAASGWVCGLTEQEIRALPGNVVDGCPPDQTWRGHHVAMAEGLACRYLIDASFDQVRLLDVRIPPMVLYFETESAESGALLGTFDGFLRADLPVHSGAQCDEVVQVAYKEIEDRAFVEASVQDREILRPAIDQIYEQMMRAEGAPE